ncbi:MAG: hypothetical protein U0264_13475 [Candidatus Kapaibacterium sp.]
MHPSYKIVTTLPLLSIWVAGRDLTAERVGYLSSKEIQQILHLQPVEFVVPNVGDTLQWIGINACYDFWKSEAKSHIADNTDHIELRNFPGEYAYIASAWIGEFETPVVVLEKVH